MIHPKDETTDFLSIIYADKDWTVMDSKLTKAALIKKINTYDRIVMMGHGCEMGLLQFSKLVIDKTFVPLLKEKSCVCIWCYADEFVNEHGLKGFYTGMFISEFIEAINYGIPSNGKIIIHSNALFAEAVNQYIDKDNMLDNVKEMYMYKGEEIYDGDVIYFNRERLYYNG